MQDTTTPAPARAHRVDTGLVCALAAVALSFAPLPVRACQLPPAFAYERVWPPVGTLDVPTNVVVEVVYVIEEPDDTNPPPRCWGSEANASYTIRPVAGGAALDHSVSTVHSGIETRRSLVLDAPLSPETEYEVLGPSCDEEETVLTRFTTGLAEDTTAPGLSSAAWGCTRVYHHLEPVGTCEYGMERLGLTQLTLLAEDETGIVRVELHASEASTLPFALLAGSSVLVAELSEDPGEFSWAEGFPAFTDYGIPPGAWKLVAVDAAGNRSAPLVLVPPLLCPGSSLDGGPPPQPDAGDSQDAGGASADGGRVATRGAGCTAGPGGNTRTATPVLALLLLVLAQRCPSRARRRPSGSGFGFDDARTPQPQGVRDHRGRAQAHGQRCDHG